MKSVSVLHLEDSKIDGELVRETLARGGIHCTIVRCDTQPSFLDALSHHQFDVILADFSLPQFDGSSALKLVRERDLDIPFIFVSGVLGEEFAIDALKNGATDYVLKTNLKRLVPALTRALEEKEAKGALKQSEESLRRSENQFQRLAEAIPQLVWTTDEQGKVQYLNDQWCHYTGLSVDYLQHHGWNDCIYSHDRGRAIKTWKLALARGMAFETEYRLKNVSSEYRWFLVRGVPVRDSGGNVFRWVGTCTDVEEQKNRARERELLLRKAQEAQMRAEKESAAKDEFLAIVSHELRTPLNAILGWSQLLKHKTTNPDQILRGLNVIESNTKAQARLVSDLLDMSRAVSGHLELNLEHLALETVVHSCVAAIQPTAEAGGIRLSYTVDPEIEPIVGDFERLRQALYNLISNAVKFTPSGGKISVSARMAGSYVRITVSDSGIGIKPDFLPHVFDRFRQAEPSSTRRFGGLGLGLSIVRTLVELHGGKVTAESEGEGKGASFHILLPTTVQSEEELSRELCSRSSSIEDIPDVSLEGIRVLVVDDEATSLEIACQILRESRATVVGARSASEGLDLASREMFDLIISDIGMEERDGFDFLRELRALEAEKEKKTPAIALTAFNGSEDRVKVMSEGFLRHLAKPIEAVDLISSVGEVVGEGASNLHCRGHEGVNER